MPNEMRDMLVEMFYENNVRCDQTIEHLVDDVMSIFENGVVVPQWINVKDRLPEEHDKYLCAEYSKTFKRYFIRTLWFTKDLYKRDRYDFPDKKGIGGFYESSGEWGRVLTENVTHWMPLPEPPKAEQRLKEMRGGNE